MKITLMHKSKGVLRCFRVIPTKMFDGKFIFLTTTYIKNKLWLAFLYMNKDNEKEWIQLPLDEWYITQIKGVYNFYETI